MRRQVSIRSLLIFTLLIAALGGFLVSHVRQLDQRVSAFRFLVDAGATPLEQSNYDAKVLLSVPKSDQRTLRDSIKCNHELNSIRIIQFGVLRIEQDDRISILAKAIQIIPEISEVRFAELIITNEELAALKKMLPKVKFVVVNHEEPRGELGGTGWAL